MVVSTRAMQDAGSSVPGDRVAELRAEIESLRTNELRWRTVASVAPGYAFEYRFRPDGGIEHLWVSDGVAGVFGCDRDELARRGGREAFIHEDDLPSLTVRRAALARGEPQRGGMRIRTVTGELKYLSATALPIRDPHTGVVIGAIGAVYDVTNLKLAEIAARDSSTMLQTVAECSADGLALFDRDSANACS